MQPNDPNKKPNGENKEPQPPKKDDKIDSFTEFYNYAGANARDMLAYVLMIIGLILLFFHQFYGGLLVGIVAGVYFSKEILGWIENYPRFLDDQGLVRTVVLGGLLIALFICAPAIFIGMGLVVLIRYFLINSPS